MVGSLIVGIVCVSFLFSSGSVESTEVECSEEMLCDDADRQNSRLALNATYNDINSTLHTTDAPNNLNVTQQFNNDGSTGQHGEESKQGILLDSSKNHTAKEPDGTGLHSALDRPVSVENPHIKQSLPPLTSLLGRNETTAQDRPPDDEKYDYTIAGIPITSKCKLKSCKTECTGSKSAEDDEESDIVEFGTTTNCFCDELCVTYGNCCFDYGKYCVTNECTSNPTGDLDAPCPTTPRPTPQSPSNDTLDVLDREHLITSDKNLTCVKPSGSNSGLKMIASCPFEYPDAEIRKKCEVIINDIHIRAPCAVNNTLLFKNQYCAQCNGIDVGHDPDVHIIEPKFQCSKADHLIAARVFQTDGISAFMDFLWSACELTFEFQDYTLPLDHMDCLPEVIDTCLDPDADETEKEACQGYQSLAAFNGGDRWYKNLHCAKCSGEDVGESLSCSAAEKDIGINAPKYPGAMQLPSFSLLLDFSGRIDVDIAFCSSGFTLSTDGKRCVRNACPTDQILIDDVCEDVIPYGFQPITSVLLLVDSGSYIQEIMSAVRSIMSKSYKSVYTNCSSLHLDLDLTPRNALCYTFVFNSSSVCASVDTYNVAHAVHHVNSSLRIIVQCLNFDPSVQETCKNSNPQWNIAPDIPASGKLSEESKQRIQNSTHRVYSYCQETRFRAVCRISYRVCFNKLQNCPKTNLNDDYEISDGFLISPYLQRKLEGWEFAVIKSSVVVCIEDLHNVSSLADLIQGYLTLIGNCLSMVCLLLTLFTYFMFPSLRTTSGKCVMSLSVALLIAQFLFQFNYLATPVTIACTILAVVQQYVWLVAFAWMNVLAIDIATTLSKMESASEYFGQIKKFKVYSILAWTLPFIWVFICILVDKLTSLKIGYGNWDVCWITDIKALMVVFAAPIATIIVCNFGLFIKTFLSLRRSFVNAKKITSTKSARHQFPVYVKLSSLMGFTWVFGFLQSVPYLSFMVFLFVLFNTLQGVFIFFSFAMSGRVRGMYRVRFSSTSSTNTGTLSSEVNQTRSTSDGIKSMVNSFFSKGGDYTLSRNHSSAELPSIEKSCNLSSECQYYSEMHGNYYEHTKL